MMGVDVCSEIKPLKKVLLHRPGKELENLIPDELERLLFDDIPYLKMAIKEHDGFANVLRDLNVEIVYLEDLVADILAKDDLKQQFIWQYIEEAEVSSEAFKFQVYEYLTSLKSNELLIQKTMAGITTQELNHHQNLIGKRCPFVTDPMPNLYFTRDPFTTIGRCVSLNRMAFEIRNRETIYADFIFRYHPLYRNTPCVYDRNLDSSLEGGDVLNLSESVLLVGISQRTEIEAIKELSKQLFYQTKESSIEMILAVKIENKRAYMHLDTLLTQVNHEQFVIHPDFTGELEILEIRKGQKETLREIWHYQTLEQVLSNFLPKPIDFILCGGGGYITSQREQWSDGANTLCVTPGEVIVYARNHVTNEQLVQHGIKIHEIRGSELSRGRGGPRCMSMPLVRER